MKLIAGLAAASVTSIAGAGVVGFIGDTTLEGGWYAFEDMYGLSMEVLTSPGSVYDTIGGLPSSYGDLTFDIGHSLRMIGQGWATWSHGYTGQVYYNNGSFATGYDMPGGVTAFDAYLEPNPFAQHFFTATGYGSAGGEVSIDFGAHGSAGASHFGFYATGETLVRVEIEGSADWAIGEIRVGVPAPGALALLGLAGLAGRRRR